LSITGLGVVPFGMTGNVESATDIRSFRIGFPWIVAKPGVPRLCYRCQRTRGKISFLCYYSLRPKLIDLDLPTFECI